MSSYHVISDASRLRIFLIINTFSKLSYYRTVEQVHITPMTSSCHVNSMNRDFDDSSHRHIVKTPKLPTVDNCFLLLRDFDDFFTAQPPMDFPRHRTIEPQEKSNGSPPPELSTTKNHSGTSEDFAAEYPTTPRMSNS
jgi:hypothetical protein